MGSCKEPLDGSNHDNSVFSSTRNAGYYLSFFSLFFEMEFRSCYPGWSAMAQSRLIATSAFWVQAIPLPQPPKYLGLQVSTTMPS